MSSTRPRRSNAASASASAPAPTGPCLLHRLPAELVKNIVELSIEEDDLAPYPHQQRTFELAGQVCRLWHDLLAHPQAYVVTDVLMAQRLAEKLKCDGTGRSVRKLGIDYSGQVWVKGRAVPPVPAIAALLDECPRLLELILIGKYSKIASMMASRLGGLTMLQRLELDINDDRSLRRRFWPQVWTTTKSFRELPQAFFTHLEGCPSLTHLNTGRLTFVQQADDLERAPSATTLGLVHFGTFITSQSHLYISSTLQATSSTLTSLHLGVVYPDYIDIDEAVEVIAPVAPNLVEFEWRPMMPWIPPDGPYPGVDRLSLMAHLRVLETGSPNLEHMIPQNALLTLPGLEHLVLNTSSDFLGYQVTSNAVVAFLTSPSSRGLKSFRIRPNQPQAQKETRLWLTSAKKLEKERILQQVRGTGIEVVLD
ncbi:hypothetical protein RQP46_002934 [Phenoliferia psychrophenolica]